MALFVIVGTSHAIQRGDKGNPDTFVGRIRDVCLEHRVLCIAEEMSRELLVEDGLEETLGARVAREDGLAHAYCDPSPAERKRLGILSFGAIDMQAGLGSWPEAVRASRMAEHFAAVESYWMNMARECPSPTLFICGANHVDTFSSRLTAAGHEVHVADRDWDA